MLEHKVGQRSGYTNDDDDDDVDRSGDDDSLWVVPEKMMFEPSVQAIVSTYDDVDAARKTGGIEMAIVVLRLCQMDDMNQQFRLSYKIIQRIHVCKLRLRRHKSRAAVDTSKGTGMGIPATTAPMLDQVDDDGDNGGERGGGGDMDRDADDDDDDALADELFALYQKEYLGECDDSVLDQFEEELCEDEQYKDVSEMDDMNAKFIGAVIEQTRDSEHTGIDKGACPVRVDEEQDSDHDLESSRPFEDESGEKLLQTFLKKRLDAEHIGDNIKPPKPQPVIVNLTPLEIDSALHMWKHSLEKTMNACVAMAHSLHTFDTDHFDSSIALEASLVLHNKAGETTDCSYVSWLKPFRKLNGRVLALDEDFGIIYPSHFNVTKLCFSGSIMIVPLVGARVRKQQREIMPATMRRLQRMFSVSISGGLVDDTLMLDLNDPDTEIGDGNMLCIACRKGGSMGTVKQCMFCLQWWHVHCNN